VAEDIILSARKEAEGMIENSEREGKAAAREYYEKEMENIRKENEQLRDQGNQQAKSINEKGEGNIKRATEKIVKTVSME
jgi:vacuolar-type H+-ATPase subunit H